MSSSERHTFTREVVSAIKELELRRASKTQQELADCAWNKLQYDLPVLEPAELQALLQQFRNNTQGYTQQEAIVADEDGELYEELESMPQPQQQPCSSALHCNPATAGSLQQLQAPYNWPQMQHKLLSLAGHVHYSLLSHPPLWSQQHGAAQQLLQLVRAVGVHAHNQELRPVMHAYVGVLLDRLAAAPAQLPLLRQLWEALGITEDNNTPGQRRSSPPGSNQLGPQPQQQQPLPLSLQQLPSEAVLALSVTAQLWQQLPGSTTQCVLWDMLYQNLMPLLERCTEQLAYSSSSSRKGAGTSRARQVHQQVQDDGSADDGDCFAHILLVAHVIELLVLGRPSSVDIGAHLTTAGVTRNLQFKGNVLVQMQNAIGCLQLMVDVQKASKQHGVWGEHVTAELRALASELKDVIGPALESGAGAACSPKVAGDNSSAVCSDGRAVRCDVPDYKDDYQASMYQPTKCKPASANILAARQAHQLQPVVLKLVKRLLNQGGKTD
eukprot:gene5054-5295_t